MILKSAGAILLFALTLYISVQYTVMERRRLLQNEGLLLLLRHIRTQISCFSSPLPEIYASFENRALADIGFLSLLQAEGLLTALSACEDRLYLEEEELRSLKKLCLLEGDYEVYPGHMDSSTLQRERAFNHYCREAMKNF